MAGSGAFGCRLCVGVPMMGLSEREWRPTQLPAATLRSNASSLVVGSLQIKRHLLDFAGEAARTSVPMCEYGVSEFGVWIDRSFEVKTFASLSI